MKCSSQCILCNQALDRSVKLRELITHCRDWYTVDRKIWCFTCELRHEERWSLWEKRRIFPVYCISVIPMYNRALFTWRDALFVISFTKLSFDKCGSISFFLQLCVNEGFWGLIPFQLYFMSWLVSCVRETWTNVIGESIDRERRRVIFVLPHLPLMSTCGANLS